MLRSIFDKSVKPVTACVMIFTVYTKGYYDAVVDVHLNRPCTFIGIVVGVVESSLLGYSIGMTYPISIPIAIGYISYVNKIESTK